jgi:cyclic pyranopterin phosphate synthase
MASHDLSHIDRTGRAQFVDVSDKRVTRRRASAEGEIRMKPATLDAIRDSSVAKGDVIAVARIAAIGGAKRAAELIPLCHPLPLETVDVLIEAQPDLPGVRIVATVGAEARTGVEMEALCAVSCGLLTVYDMCKAIDRGMQIGPVRLLHKTGGATGEWRRESASGGTAG